MRERITTWLDLAGLVLLAAAGAVFAARALDGTRWSLAAGMAVGGALLIAGSAIATALASPSSDAEDEE